MTITIHSYQQFAASNLYTFVSPFTFTTGGVVGRNGGNLTNFRTAYSATAWTQDTVNNYFNVTTQGIQRWTVPATASYRIVACGAGGGGHTTLTNTGRGVCVSTIITLTQGSIIQILCGHRGVNNTVDSTGTGGGGGTYVVRADNTPILVAGGGGGCWQTNSSLSDALVSTSGGAGASGVAGTGGGGGATPNGANSYSSGAGFTGNSGNLANGTTNIASSFTNNGQGGGAVPNGGFGGGGSLHGGGGGYSGGGGVNFGATGAAGGGGSFDINGAGNAATLFTTTIQTASAGYNTSAGFVVITRL